MNVLLCSTNGNDGHHFTFLQPVADHAEVVIGGAYYLLAMMNTSGGHQH